MIVPEQIWDAVFWVTVISVAGGWARYLLKWSYKYFIEDKVK